MDATQRKRTITLKMRLRASELKQKENEYIRMARAKQKEQEQAEFERLKERIQSEEGGYSFEDFSGLLDRMRAPFSCDLETPDGTSINVLVSPDDAAVMLDEAALGAMKKVLVAGGRQKEDGDNDSNEQEPPPKKRRNTAAADTGLGLGCSKAFYDCDRRDRTQNAKALATKLKQDLAEKDAILRTLTLLERKRKGYEVALKAWKQTRDSGVATTVVGCFDVVPFWVCRESDTDSYLLFLRLFLPRYGWGYLWKSKEKQWVAIHDNILGKIDLTASSVNAKEEQLRRKLRTIEKDIHESEQTGEEANEEGSL
jgi:hypothetical protein